MWMKDAADAGVARGLGTEQSKVHLKADLIT